MRSKTVSFLRGLAIIGVVMVHTTMRFDGMSSILRSCLSFGQMGCQVFFLLSAYCLCLSNADSVVKVLPFYKKRFMSLAPAYWSSMIIGFLIYWLSISMFGNPTLKIEPNSVFMVLNVTLAHGLLPLYKSMNGVVAGGWFVGTIMILYYLYPLLNKLYFNQNSHIWSRYRWFLFPVLVTVICWIPIIITGYDQESFCLLGSAKYFHFLNQLPSFVLGFSLYDIMKNRTVRYVTVKCCFFWILSVLFFYVECKFSYMLVPVLAAIASIYSFLCLDSKQSLLSSNLGQFISKLGDNSFSIYLTHFWIVSTVVYILQHQCHFMYGTVAPTLSYFSYLPIVLVLVYFVSGIYSKWIFRINSMFNKLLNYNSL